jgi:hypothetical protein
MRKKPCGVRQGIVCSIMRGPSRIRPRQRKRLPMQCH